MEQDSERDSMELEIDLGKYLDILKRWWWFIGLGVLLTGGMAFVVSQPLPTIYEAEVDVASVRPLSQISLSPGFKTLSEQGLDISARQKSLFAIAKGGDVASAVATELGGSLAPGERQASSLLGMVTVTADGDLIRIKVQNQDPQKAVKIADAWAKVFANRVNLLYTENPTTLEQVQGQTADAWQRYQTAEGTLNQFIGQNRIDALGAEIGARQNAVGDLYATQRNLERVLQDAKSLQEVVGKDSAQVPSGTGAVPSDAGSRLAMLIIRANAAALSYAAAQPIQLQLSTASLTDVSQPSLRAQLDTLITAVEARKRVVESQIADPALQAQILSLQKEQEQQVAKKLELTTARDLAWSAYKTLASKVQEIQMTQQSSGTILRLVGAATVQPIASKTTTNAMIAALVGLLLAVAIAFVVEFLDPRVRSAKELAKELNLTASEIETGERAGALVVPKAFYQIWANLFLRPEPVGKTLLICDIDEVHAGESARALGSIAAQSGRPVLLVDANIQNPSLDRLFGLSNARGWSNLLNEEHPNLSNCPQPSGVKNLTVVTSGAAGDRIEETIMSPRLGPVMAALKEKADWVLFCVPSPVLSVAPLVMARHIDGVLLLATASVTRRDLLTQSKERLASVGANVLGVVVFQRAGGVGERLRGLSRFGRRPQTTRQSAGQAVAQVPK